MTDETRASAAGTEPDPAYGLLAPRAESETAATGEAYGGDGSDWSFLPEGMQRFRREFDNPDSFWTALGRPENPDGYALPDSWSADSVSADTASRVNEILSADKGEFMRVCHACNLTGEQAESLFGVIGGLLAENIRKEEADVKSPEEVVTSVWPKETQKHLDAARRGARYAGLGDELDQAGLSSNPLVLNLARALGEAVGESSAPGSKGYGVGLPRGERAKEEMHRVIASDAYRNNDPEAIRKVEELSRRAGVD